MQSNVSSSGFARTIPVGPPMVDGKMDPAASKIGVLYRIEPLHMYVAN